MATLTTEQQDRVKALAIEKGVWAFSYAPLPSSVDFNAMQIEFAAALLSEFSAQKAQEPYAGQQWKSGNEYLPYHPSASHVSPAYRDGWNACYQAATPSLRVNPVAVALMFATDSGGPWPIEAPSILADRWIESGKVGLPLGVIMEADKVDELIKLRAENAALDKAAKYAEEMNSHGQFIAAGIRLLKQPNDARISEIEGKTE